MQRGKILEILPTGKPPVHRAFTGQHHADVPADLRRVADDVELPHPRRPGRGSKQRAQDSDGRGLPGAVRPEQAEQLPAVDLQGDSVDRGDPAGLGCSTVPAGTRRPDANAPGQILKLDGGFGLSSHAMASYDARSP